jgi:poly-gamma-glutamate synthesis protein (capsule biosynthesis protein)
VFSRFRGYALFRGFMVMRKTPLALLIVAGPLIAALVGFLLTRDRRDFEQADIPPTGPLTIALAGDVLLTAPLGAAENDPAFRAIQDAVRAAHFATANIEMNLLGAEASLKADAQPAPRWPYGSALDAATLHQLGFDAVALANDHATDFGVDGMMSTIRVLQRARLLHAGSGTDLAAARRPALAGPSGGSPRIAFLSVAASSLPDARATASRPAIAGRPGVNPLRYSASITVDAATFETLKDSLAALNAGPPAGERQLVMFGTPIAKGERTSVEFTVSEEDQRAILEEIREARSAAEVVIVSIHSHEPANASEEPAEFVRQFARAAVDAGASVVAAHGPHRIRGIEWYRDTPILYGLGNFLYQTAELDFRAANLYDAGADLYQAAVGALGGPPKASPTAPEDPSWWQGLLGIVSIEPGRPVDLRLVPLTLAGNSRSQKGIPRKAEGQTAEAILSGVQRLSSEHGVRLEVVSGIGFVRGDSPNPKNR